MESAAGAPDLIRTMSREIVAAFFAYPHLVAGALSVLVAALIVGGFWAFRGTVEGARSARVALRASQLRAQRDHRALILIARIKGPGGSALRDLLTTEIVDQFGAFAFGAPVQVESFPLRLPLPNDGQSVDRKRRIAQTAVDSLARAQGDILIWGKRHFFSGKVELRLTAPPSPNQVPEAHEITFKWRAGDDPTLITQAVAYLCARRARPVLNRPQDYKPEKLQPIVKALHVLATGGPDDLNDPARLEILGDFASGALSLGERGGEARWLQEALDARKQFLDRIDRAADPAAWGRAQQEVGRALAALGEREADRAKLEEAVMILKLSLDALRATESLQSAEVAMRALSRAEQTLAQRKRIGLRWPV